MRFTARYLLSPPGYFGLPEDGFLVVPAQPGRQIQAGWLDTRTGTLVTHGTLPEYRKEEDKLTVSARGDGRTISLADNFLTVQQDGDDPNTVAAEVGQFVDLLTQGLGLHLGHVVSASLVSFTDESGMPAVRSPLQIPLMNARLYNLVELREFAAASLEWALSADERARKSLSYFESALILRDFGRNLAYGDDHRGFISRLAFLQLFKAIVVLVGEPSVDRDYQSRAQSLGLAPDFWNTRVKPFYHIRSDADVAHHSMHPGSERAVEDAFGQALSTYREVLRAYLDTIRSRGV